MREAVKKVRPSKKDLRKLEKGNLTGVMTGKDILDGMQGRDKDRESSKEGRSYRGGKEGKGRGNSRKEAHTWARHTCSTSPSSPHSACRYPTRILRSATYSIPRFMTNYSLPQLTELHAGNDSVISLISAASSDCEYLPRTSTAPEEIANTPQLGKLLPRNLCSSE